MNANAAYVLAARSLIEHGSVTPDHPEHLTQHPACAIGGRHETVFTRCCGRPVALGRPMWACEIPPDTGFLTDCCDRPFVIFGES